MYEKYEISKVIGRQVLDSRGNPTVEAEVFLNCGISAIADVPSGASTGTFEAVELRDKDDDYNGLSVKNAVNNINNIISEILIGENSLKQVHIDNMLIAADGSDNKGKLGANALLAVSLATARVAAKALGIPLYRYLGGNNAKLLPVPMMNILNGGKHAANTVDFQEFMIMPIGAKTFSDCIRICAEIYHNLKKKLASTGKSTGVGDEGGFAPDLADAEEVLTYIVDAIESSGYIPGKDVVIALDAASSEIYNVDSGLYHFEGESKIKGSDVYRNTDQMIEYYEHLSNTFPIVSIEDALAEDDWEGWRRLTQRLGNKIQLVGDDLFVTNRKRLHNGIIKNTANSILVKVNQIGTVTEAMDAIELAKNNGYTTVISHRSGETEDTFIADLAVAVNAGQIKTGAPCRSERTAKYNRLIRIEEELGASALYKNAFLKAL